MSTQQRRIPRMATTYTLSGEDQSARAYMEALQELLDDQVANANHNGGMVLSPKATGRVEGLQQAANVVRDILYALGDRARIREMSLEEIEPGDRFMEQCYGRHRAHYTFITKPTLQKNGTRMAEIQYYDGGYNRRVWDDPETVVLLIERPHE